jgi:hypothetical protein
MNPAIEMQLVLFSHSHHCKVDDGPWWSLEPGTFPLLYKTATTNYNNIVFVLASTMTIYCSLMVLYILSVAQQQLSLLY